MTNYVHDDTSVLEERLWRLVEEKAKAELEVAHASYLNADLGGPMAAALEDSRKFAQLVEELKRIIERVSAGYPYWERDGFEAGVEAIGEISSWQPLSETPAPGVVFGHDKTTVRLPIDVQYQYKKALESGLFDAFTVCCHVDPDSLEPATYYLFGVLQAPIGEAEAVHFLIAQWVA